MATFDVRDENNSVIQEIVFGDKRTSEEYSVIASIRQDHNMRGIYFYDEDGDITSYAKIISKQHAQDLIKALGKAIELGWLK